MRPRPAELFCSEEMRAAMFVASVAAVLVGIEVLLGKVQLLSAFAASMVLLWLLTEEDEEGMNLD